MLIPSLPGHQAKRRQRGATLIEILVSVLVIAFGVLAMAAVQSNSVKFHKTTEYRATATLLAADIADRMRANALGTSSGNYAWASGTKTYAALTTTTVGSPISCGTVNAAGSLQPCTAQQIATNDLVDWRNRLRLSLPGASDYVSAYDASQKAVDLWVIWLDPEEKDLSDPTKSIDPASAECPPAAVWSAGTAKPHCLFLRVAL